MGNALIYKIVSSFPFNHLFFLSVSNRAAQAGHIIYYGSVNRYKKAAAVFFKHQ